MNSNSKICISIFILTVFLFSLVPVSAQEIFSDVYTGEEEAVPIIKNMDFRDVEAQGKNYWARDAIYNMSALSIIKGFGDKYFRPNKSVTKIEALAYIYRAVGREDEAKQVANIVNQPPLEGRDKAAIVWGDGYAWLAFNDGIINLQQYNDAMIPDQSSLDPAYNFLKYAPVTKQEVAEWFAKILELNPVYSEQTIYNSFKDWQAVEVPKIPFVEAALREKIIEGTSDGYLRPNNSVTREQMAQILNNARKLILARQELTEKYGFVEKIDKSIKSEPGMQISTTNIMVRNNDGKLDSIVLEDIDSEKGHIVKEVIVIGSKAPGDSSILKEQDEVSYIVDKDNNIKYIKISDKSNEAQIKMGKIKSIDKDNLNISIQDKDLSVSTYKLSENVEVIIDGKSTSLDNIYTDCPVKACIKNNIVTRMEIVEILDGRDKKITSGIVEDVSSQLGYISLYAEDGKKSFNLLRIYNFLDPSFVDVTRNGRRADINDIMPGDTVFINLDDDGYVAKISGRENYDIRYGEILFKAPTFVVVQYEDGTKQHLRMDNDVSIVYDDKSASYEDIDAGSRVKLFINNNKLKELIVQNGSYNISDIYKAKIMNYDNYHSTIGVSNLEKLEIGKWTKTIRKGSIEIPIQEKARVYAGDKKIQVEDIADYKGDEVYIALERGLGGVKQIAAVNITSPNSKELVYSDSLRNVVTGRKEFALKHEYGKFNYDENSIIIKNDKLVTGSNLLDNDEAYVVINRDYDSGNYNAGVIQVKEKTYPSNGVKIFRGRIREVNEGRDFTFKSFSIFDGYKWKYYNTPKTFVIDDDTKLFDKDGVVNNREFDDDYVGKVITTAASNLKAEVISHIPFGIYNLRGKVDLEYGKHADDKLNIKNVRIYDVNKGVWKNAHNAEIDLRKDTIILKDGKCIPVSEIVRGNTVSVLKKDNTITGEGLIIIVED